MAKHHLYKKHDNENKLTRFKKTAKILFRQELVQAGSQHTLPHHALPQAQHKARWVATAVRGQCERQLQSVGLSKECGAHNKWGNGSFSVLESVVLEGRIRCVDFAPWVQGKAHAPSPLQPS